MDSSELYKKIIKELNNFSFKRNSLSYQYLIDAIYIVAKNNIIVKDFKNYVYPQIASKYDTKCENVLWNISKLIRLMYFNTDEKIIKDYFNIEYGENLSPKAFIMYISYKILEII